MNSHLSFKDIGLIFFVLIVWGTGFPTSKMMFTEITPLLALTIRSALVALTFTFFVKNLPDKKILKVLIYFIIIQYAFHQSLNWIALKHIDVSNITLIQQSGTLFSVLIGVFLLKESLTMPTMVGMLISVLGLVVVFGAPNLSGQGLYVGFIIAASFFGAISTVLLKRMGKIDIPTLMFYPHFAGIFIFGILSFALEDNQIEQLRDADWLKLSLILFYHVTVMSLAFIVWQRLIERNETTKVTPFLLLYPVFGVFFSIVLLSEPITQNLIIGGGLTLLGGALLTLRFKNKQGKIEITDPADDTAEIYVDKIN